MRRVLVALLLGIGLLIGGHLLVSAPSATAASQMKAEGNGVDPGPADVDAPVGERLSHADAVASEGDPVGYVYDDRPDFAHPPAGEAAVQNCREPASASAPVEELGETRRDSFRLGHDLSAPTSAGSVRNVNPLGGSANCVNCAVATDATLGGAPASALNVRPGVTGQPISILEDVYGSAFKPIGGRADIERLLLDAGDGSRGIVFGSRGPDVPGHVFNAVNQNGVVRFLDGQSGGVASFDGFDAFEFLVTN